MIDINLLPVRAARKRENLRFQLSISILCLVLLCLCLAYFKLNLNQREKRVNTQLAAVQEEIKKLNEVVGEIDRLKKDKAKLQQKLLVIDKLEKGRLSAAHILDEISEQMPPKIWLETLEKKGEGLRIVGVALDNETIANFMTVLEKSKYFRRVELEVTEQIDRQGMKLKKFSLSCSSTS